MRKSLRASLSVAVLSVGLAFIPSTSAALFTEEHVDIDIRFPGVSLANPTGFELGWYDRDSESSFLAGEARAVAFDNSRTVRPAGSAWNFVGVAPGADFWVMPQNQLPGRVYLGIGAESIPFGLFAGSLVSMQLVGVEGPGAFSLYRVAAGGSPTALMASSDGLTDADRIVLSPGAHAHFNWAFTRPGEYRLLFEAVGTVGGIERRSGPVAFGMTVIPEPTALAPLLLTGSLLARRRR